VACGEPESGFAGVKATASRSAMLFLRHVMGAFARHPPRYLHLPHRLIDMSLEGLIEAPIKFTYPDDLNLWLQPIPIGRWMVPDPRFRQTLL
jgi:hypothetical protein